MKNEKFRNQINKNKAAATSTDDIADALYEDEMDKEAQEPIKVKPKLVNVMVDTGASSKPVARRLAGRPRGEETIQKTVYIPKYLWPFVQAAIKKNGGNLQSYFGSLVETDINKNRDKYKELAEIYRALDGDNL